MNGRVKYTQIEIGPLTSVEFVADSKTSPALRAVVLTQGFGIAVVRAKSSQIARFVVRAARR